MVSYDLSHLSQSDRQDVCGPIQDDEALFLYALIRTMRLKNVVEIGGLNGYSAANFSKAVGSNGKVVTVDIKDVPRVAENHNVVVCDCATISTQIGSIDLVFFDAHNYDSQMKFFNNMVDLGFITDKTILALHDTGTHPKQYFGGYETDQGFVHQTDERRMVNVFVDLGYHALCLHTDLTSHTEEFPFRHGLTILSKFQRLSV
jgi:hypothetical protein